MRKNNILVTRTKELYNQGLKVFKHTGKPVFIGHIGMMMKKISKSGLEKEILLENIVDKRILLNTCKELHLLCFHQDLKLYQYRFRSK